jgi:hypothetical protein
MQDAWIACCLTKAIALITSQLDACLGEKVSVKNHDMLSVFIVKDKNFLMCNSSVLIKLWETDVGQTWPAKILMVPLLERSLKVTPCGKLDHFIRQQNAPESRRMWNNCLITAFIELTLNTVVGVFALGL